MDNDIKSELRALISEEIAALPEDYVTFSNEMLFKRVIELDEFIIARNIFLYHNVKREPETIEIAKAALALGKTVAFPYCYNGGIMEARVINDLSELQPAMLGIPTPPKTAPIIQPEELELMVVPGLAFDRKGYRLGYGGGYYDRYLHGLPAFTVGLTRERLLKEDLPVQPHDIPVMCIVTEERFVEMRN